MLICYIVKIYKVAAVAMDSSMLEVVQGVDTPPTVRWTAPSLYISIETLRWSD